MIRRLACSVLALSLGTSLATAHPYRYEDDLVQKDRVDDHRFAQPPVDPVEPIAIDVPVRNPDNDIDLVVDRDSVRAALAARRTQNLALFHAYRTGGVYPHNFVQDGKLNVWRDDEGHFCAAATIIMNSGNAALALAVPDVNNFIRLKDVTDGDLMDWMLTSGFTQAEIAAIQEPFVGRIQPQPLEPVRDEQRLAEDARLAKRYAQVERQLIKARNKSLDRAVDRLMQRPELAQQLVDSVFNVDDTLATL